MPAPHLRASESREPLGFPRGTNRERVPHSECCRAIVPLEYIEYGFGYIKNEIPILPHILATKGEAILSETPNFLNPKP